MTKRLLCAFLALVMVIGLVPFTALHAHAASAMKASDDVILYLKSMEGFTPIPRWDYVQWTVGYGNRCPEEDLERYLKEGIPIEEADALFLDQLAYFEDQVNAFMDRHGLTFKQHEFDAVLSVTYNCGAAWLYNANDLMDAVINGTRGNTLIALLTHRCTAGGEYLPGLMRRRLTEADMFLNGRYNTQALDNYCYVFYDAGEGTASSVAQGYDCNLYAVPMATAKRDGYTFLGWYTAETGGAKVTYLDENLHQTTLYAHWAEGDGGYDGDDTTTIPDGVLVTVTGDVVNVRSGPSTAYPVVASVVYGDKIAVTEVAQTDGRLWGKIDKGWLCLEYTDYSEVVPDDGDDNTSTSPEEERYQVPVYATVVGTSSIKIYNGPHTGYPQIGTLSEGQEVLLVEVYKLLGSWWARLESGGWVCLNRYLLLHNDNKLAHSVTVTITNSYLNVRSGPGTENSWVGSLNKGDQVTILAVEIVDSAIWGQFSGGWISLQYTTFDESLLDQYWNHTYGDWYTVTESTCVTPGTEHRMCLYCDDYESRETEPTDHTYGQWYQVEAGTCVDHGLEQRDCTVCDAYETRETELTGHTYGEWYVTVEATCTVIGIQQRDCLHCDVFETQEIGYGDHVFGAWYTTVEPTLTESGEERRDCACGHYETREVEPVDHIYGDWYTTVDPTCTEPGEQRRDCQYCDHYESQQIAATGHSYGQWETVSEPTCTTEGQKQCVCATCQEVQYEAIDPLGHTMGQWYTAKEATCTENGLLRRTCANCDHVEESVIAATGHSMDAWYLYREATCTENGENRRECQHCDHYETESIPATGHSYGDWYTYVEATATSKGEERRECKNCDHYESRETECLVDVITRTYGTLTGYDYLNIRSGPGTTYAWAGRLNYGDRVEIFEIVTVGTDEWGRIEKGWICLTGYMTLETVEEVVEHTHSYGDWYTVTEATATEKGLERRDCACGHYETRETDPVVETVTKIYGTLTGHRYLNIRSGPATNYALVGKLSYGDRVEILEIVDYGSHQWGRIEQGWIMLTGYMTLETVEEPVEQEHTHSYGDWYTVTEATCTTAGQQRRDCSCGHYETQTVAATGHTYGEWYTVTEPTATEKGLERRDCACGHYETRETDPVAETVTKLYGTLTGYDYLNIRSGPGTSYAWAGRLNYGDRVEIFETVTVGTDEWGRIEKGWICLTGYMTLETVEEVVEHTHSYGDWYTVTEATADANGLERRDCACGHYETRETQYEGNYVTKVYATITANSLNVRGGAGTNYNLVGVVYYGSRYEVYEQVTVGNNVWGRIDAGWICLTGYTTLESVQVEAEPEALVLRVITDVLNIRSGAGTGYEVVGTLVYGNRVEVLEQVTVNGITWARIAEGWVSMAYLA